MCLLDAGARSGKEATVMRLCFPLFLQSALILDQMINEKCLAYTSKQHTRCVSEQSEALGLPGQAGSCLRSLSIVLAHLRPLDPKLEEFFFIVSLP